MKSKLAVFISVLNFWVPDRDHSTLLHEYKSATANPTALEDVHRYIEIVGDLDRALTGAERKLLHHYVDGLSGHEEPEYRDFPLCPSCTRSFKGCHLPGECDGNPHDEHEDHEDADDEE